MILIRTVRVNQISGNLPSVLTVGEESNDTSGPSGILSTSSTIPPRLMPPRSSDMEPCASTEIMEVECPLCFLNFPITEVEQHADGCSASFGLLADCDNGGLNAGDSEHEISDTETDGSMVTLNSCINTLKENSLKVDDDSIRVTVKRKMDSTMALTGKDYRLAGEMMAMSVIQGGQAPHFISAQIFKYLCGDRSVNNMNSIVHKELCEKVSIYMHARIRYCNICD